MIRSPAGFDGGDRIKRYLDYYQPSYGVMMLSAGQAFTPASLFAAGEIGAWYDPSDLTTMFQDSAGTTPVTGVEQAVGRINDKSGRGNHATQSTPNSRPILRARYNQLTYSEQFDNAAWTKGTAISVSQNFDGTADRITYDGSAAFATATQAIVEQSASIIGGSASKTITIVARIKSATGSNQTVRIKNTHAAVVDNFSSNLTVTSDYQNFTFTVTNNSSAGNGSQIAGFVAGTSNAAYDIVVAWMDMRISNESASLPAYQRIAAATDYDTTGFLPFLSFDGTDDFLVTGTINPGAVDKAQVFTGVRKLSDAAAACLVELGTIASAVNGSMQILAPHTVAPTYRFGSRGTAFAPAISPSSYAAPITNVVTGLGDISGDSALLRINGTQVAADTSTDQGTGNYLSYPIYIGRRGGSTIPLNGRIYSLIVRFSAANLSDSVISQTETWVNTKTGAY